MLKSILFISLSFVLTFSILGPSFLKLYTSDLDEIVVVDTSEEEQQKKTSSEIDDFKIFEEIHIYLGVINNQSDKSLSNYGYKVSSADYLEIQLPPPRYKV